MKQELYFIKALLCGAFAFALMCYGLMFKAFVRVVL